MPAGGSNRHCRNTGLRLTAMIESALLHPVTDRQFSSLTELTSEIQLQAQAAVFALRQGVPTDSMKALRSRPRVQLEYPVELEGLLASVYSDYIAMGNSARAGRLDLKLQNLKIEDLQLLDLRVSSIYVEGHWKSEKGPRLRFHLHVKLNRAPFLVDQPGDSRPGGFMPARMFDGIRMERETLGRPSSAQEADGWDVYQEMVLDVADFPLLCARLLERRVLKKLRDAQAAQAEANLAAAIAADTAAKALDARIEEVERELEDLRARRAQRAQQVGELRRQSRSTQAPQSELQTLTERLGVCGYIGQV